MVQLDCRKKQNSQFNSEFLREKKEDKSQNIKLIQSALPDLNHQVDTNPWCIPFLFDKDFLPLMSIELDSVVHFVFSLSKKKKNTVISEIEERK